MKTIRFLFTVIIMLIAIQHSQSQNLVQSFIECNNIGNSAHFGYSLSGGCDVNNDNYDDVIVSAFYFNSNTGRVYIFYGGNIMDNRADVILNGENTGDNFGYKLSYAGDVNNDGYDDIMVGVPNSSSQKGKVCIFYGGINMDNSADIIITNVKVFYCGSSLANAGDVKKVTSPC